MPTQLGLYRSNQLNWAFQRLWMIWRFHLCQDMFLNLFCRTNHAIDCRTTAYVGFCCLLALSPFISSSRRTWTYHCIRSNPLPPTYGWARTGLKLHCLPLPLSIAASTRLGYRRVCHEASCMIHVVDNASCEACFRLCVKLAIQAATTSCSKRSWTLAHLARS